MKQLKGARETNERESRQIGNLVESQSIGKIQVGPLLGQIFFIS